jgi:hypothetical protein
MRNSASVFESSLSFDLGVRETSGISPCLGRHRCAPRTSPVQHFSRRVQRHLYGADGQLLKPGLNTQIPTAFDLLHIEAFVWNRKMSAMAI